MDRVRSSINLSGLTTYLGPVNVLNNQQSFLSIFGKSPTMIWLNRRAVGSCTAKDTGYIRTKLMNFCDIYQFHLLCNIIQLQYVDTEIYDNHRMLNDNYLALSGFKIVSKFNGKLVSLTPDDLCKPFIKLLHRLTPNTTTWSLASLFFLQRTKH